MSIRPTAHHHSNNSKESSTLPIDESNKKELRQETADIRGFTLMFEDADMEIKWNVAHLDRQRSITTRYLLCASIFQGLFFWSDVIEHKSMINMISKPDYSNNNNDHDHLFHMGLIRLLLGGFPLLACFLVSTGLLIPSQLTVFWMNICYGIPSLAVKYLMSPSPSHWDSLFLVYGLCFFILPKISPLNFIFGFSGAIIFTVLFIYISSFRLSFQEWLLSNILLLFIVTLFCYISYSSERVGRERWLLRQRLQRERIDLRIVVSSIRDDLARVSNDERPFPLDAFRHHPSNIVYSSRDRAMRLLSSFRGRNSRNNNNNSSSDSGSGSNNNSSGTSAESFASTKQVITKNERMVLFFKGIAAWALCYGMGYTFDQASLSFSSSSHSEINTSAAFALLMHTMGFSVFLLYVTGQLRWIALNGVVSLVLLRIFNRTIDSNWVVFSTHTVGYILLAACIVVMVLVFGGVVLVWTQLIDFLKQILIKYPHVKDEILENKVLEQVLIEYIADMPTSKTLLHNPNSNITKVLHVVPSEEDIGRVRDDSHEENITISSQSHSHLHPHSSTFMEEGFYDSSYQNKSMAIINKTTISARRPNCCYFCLKPDPILLIPACSGWQKQLPSSSSSSSSSSDSSNSSNNNGNKPSTGIAMCTPYTTITLERDEAVAAIHHLEATVNTLKEKYKFASDQAKNLSQRLQESDHALQTLNNKMIDMINNEKKSHEIYVKDLLSQHNAQLSSIKKLNKSLHQKMLKIVKEYQNMEQRHQDQHQHQEHSIESFPVSTSESGSNSNNHSNSNNTSGIHQILQRKDKDKEKDRIQNKSKITSKPKPSISIIHQGQKETVYQQQISDQVDTVLGDDDDDDDNDDSTLTTKEQDRVTNVDRIKQTNTSDEITEFDLTDFEELEKLLNYELSLFSESFA